MQLACKICFLKESLKLIPGDLRRAAVEMAQSWRKDPTLAKLQAMVIAFNDKRLIIVVYKNRELLSDWAYAMQDAQEKKEQGLQVWKKLNALRH